VEERGWAAGGGSLEDGRRAAGGDCRRRWTRARARHLPADRGGLEELVLDLDLDGCRERGDGGHG
jgi:hypothetical protein